MSNEELNLSVVGDKVYAVSSGEYSDYSIDCVFRTRKEAEGWISKRWAPNNYAIRVNRHVRCTASHSARP